MAAVPVILHGVFMPDARSASDKPIKGTMIGYASIPGLEVGGGPIIPDTPPDVPVDPPEQPTGGLAVVIKPAPASGGWGLASDGGSLQWYFVPSQSGGQPKRP